MAQYSTDFSEYTTGSAPSGWTRLYGTTNATVETYTGALGGKVLYRNGATIMSWDSPGTSVTDVEVLAKVRRPSGFSPDIVLDLRPLGRGAGAAANESGYVAGPRATSDTATDRSIVRYVTGSFSTGSGSPSKVLQ